MRNVKEAYRISLLGRPEHNWLSPGEALSHVTWNNPDLTELTGILQRKNAELLDGYIDTQDPPSSAPMHLREVQSTMGFIMEYILPSSFDARINQAFDAELSSDELAVAFGDLRLHQLVLSGLYEELRAQTDRP